MSEAEPSAAGPRRTPLVLWLLLATLGMAGLFVGLAVFGPDPPIVVGRATTRITTPLGDDGLPDYAAAWLAASRVDAEGQTITPERNGAIPFLRATWGSDDGGPTPEQLKRLCAELGMEHPPRGPRLEPIETDATKEGVRRFLRRRYTFDRSPATAIERRRAEAWQRWFDLGGPVVDPVDQELDEAAVRAVLYACQPVTRPWTGDDLPFLAAWCERNAEALELVREACEAEAWRLPSASLFGAERGGLISVLLSSVQNARDVARTLNTRSMLHLGEGRADEAARDAESLLRLADHLRSGPTLIEQLVAAAIEGIGRAVVRDVCHDGRASVERLRSIAAFLDGVDSEAPLLRALDAGERYFGLDTAIAVMRGASLSELDAGFGSFDPVLSAVRIEWNVVLRSQNEYFDDLLAAARSPRWTTRRDRLQALEAEIEGIATPTGGRLASAVVSAGSRGAIVADLFRQLLTPAIAAVFDGEDRLTCHRQLTRVAVALELARRRDGAYPDTLDTLTPAFLRAAPVDLFRGAPLVYRKTEEGYLLYSSGANGVDDGGSNEGGTWGAMTLEGREIDDQDDGVGEIPVGADDLSLRMPPVVDSWPWEIEAGADEDARGE